MTEIKAILRIRTDSYAAFYNANLVYDLGEMTHIVSGTNAGMWKVGDGITAWRNLPFSPRTAALGAPGVVAGSNAVFFGKINADGTFTLNGIAQAVQDINAKDTAQDTTLSTHGGRISQLETTVAGMSGAVIYIGSVDEFTDDLNAMSEADRNALLTARAVAIRGHVQDGYTLEDKGSETEVGRFNYWQYQSDGTWFDLGERGDVSIATNTDYGIVKGSAANLGVGMLSDGTMQVNGLATKLAAVDAKDGEQDGRLTDIEADLSAFEEGQEAFNSDTAGALDDLDARAADAETRLDGVEAKNAEQDTAIAGEIERAQNGESELGNYIGQTATAIYVSLADETARAQAEEAGLQAAVESERDLRVDADEALTESVEAETGRATNRENEIETELTQEAARAMGEEQSLAASIQTLQTGIDRGSVDNAFTSSGTVYSADAVEIKIPAAERRGIEDFTLKSFRIWGNKSPTPPVLTAPRGGVFTPRE